LKEATNNNEKYILHSVETALSVMDLFFTYEELSPTDVTHYLGINRSTAFRFLVTLEQSGYITKTEKSKYRLSVKVSTLGQIAHNRMELIGLIHPYLCRLSEETGESSHLVIMDSPTHVTFVDKCVGSLWLKMDILLGYTQYAHLTATGKSILAYESDQFINQYIRTATFEPHTPNSIKDAKELLKTLDAVKEQGYSFDNEETEIGLSCYAVPILSYSGQPVAAISSSGPTTRMNANRDKHLAALHSAAEQIQKGLQ
jgi:IclR family KDG regulon transcriptional repressor